MRTPPDIGRSFASWSNRIELRFDQIQKGKRTECPLNSGEIHLKTVEDSSFDSVSRGDKTLLQLFCSAVSEMQTQEESLWQWIKSLIG